ncbi:C-type lectin mannose-binding isoform [Tetranychus urticae]|uniref:C-type lectin domain-containing protein n=1 Tax=Tetranychus urticae TaxID=32264 RepID=T1KMV5_TETUR|nr:C-type lectin mannose-binding isoform [Tetranychus urticae]
MFSLQVNTLLITITFTLQVISCSLCPDGWRLINRETSKCVRYFKDNVNYTEAEYICRNIYEGHLIVIESKQEQRSLVQYLYGEIGFTKSPVTWIGIKLEPPNKLITADSSTSKYTNFDAEPVDFSSERCMKIFSLGIKNENSEHGLWTPDNCGYGDSGFVCQKLIIDRGREIPQGDDPLAGKNEVVTTQFLLDQFKEQLTLIKEICESQMKAIERLSSNHIYMLQHVKQAKDL